LQARRRRGDDVEAKKFKGVLRAIRKAGKKSVGARRRACEEVRVRRRVGEVACMRSGTQTRRRAGEKACKLGVGGAQARRRERV